jgi:hypothetical protein
MLKTVTLTLGHADSSAPVTLTELPALIADRYARAALVAAGAPPDGGVVSLAFEHLPAVLRLADQATDLLQPFVQTDRTLRSWQNVFAVQRAALTLHAGFIVERPKLDVPVALMAEQIKRSDPDLGVSFCSAPLAAVLHSGRATYREMETVLSTEDVFNLLELVNVEAIRDWRAHQQDANRR